MEEERAEPEARGGHDYAHRIVLFADPAARGGGCPDGRAVVVDPRYGDATQP